MARVCFVSFGRLPPGSTTVARIIDGTLTDAPLCAWLQSTPIHSHCEAPRAMCTLPEMTASHCFAPTADESLP